MLHLTVRYAVLVFFLLSQTQFFPFLATRLMWSFNSNKEKQVEMTLWSGILTPERASIISLYLILYLERITPEETKNKAFENISTTGKNPWISFFCICSHEINMTGRCVKAAKRWEQLTEWINRFQLLEQILMWKEQQRGSWVHSCLAVSISSSRPALWGGD